MTSSAPALGLTSAEAERRLAAEGPNEPAAVGKEFRAARQILASLANPLALLLLAASIVSAVLGQVVNAVLIACMVLLSVTLNFLQTYRSQRAAERLRLEVAPTATALRDGSWIRIPRRELVTGDTCGWRPATSCPRTPGWSKRKTFTCSRRL